MTACTVWASALAFACILCVLGLLLCVPFFVARLRGVHPVLDRVMDRVADATGAAPPPSAGAHAHRHPAPKAFIRSLQVARYKAPPEGDVEAAATEDCCAICFSEYEPGDLVARLWCSHLYHRDCIAAWLKLDATCPICKAQLLSAWPRPPGKAAPGCCRCPRSQQQQQQPAPAAGTPVGDGAAASGNNGSGGAGLRPPPQAAEAYSPPVARLQLHTMEGAPMAGAAGYSP